MKTRGSFRIIIKRLNQPALCDKAQNYLGGSVTFLQGRINKDVLKPFSNRSRLISYQSSLWENQKPKTQQSFPCVEQHQARSEKILKSKINISLNQSEDPANQNLVSRDSGKNKESFSSSQISEGPEPNYSNTKSGYKIYHYPDRFQLDYGQVLSKFDLAYETWGNLSPEKDNAILIHTGLSASSHAKSHNLNRSPGWWESFIGHGSSYPIDLDKYFVICSNVLGSCYGSTGPSSIIDSETNERFGTNFPIFSIFDMVRAQFKLLDHLGICKLYASIGSSMGGMQSIAAAWLEPERVQRVVSISGCGRTPPSSIALRYAQRSVLMADPNWNNGFYYENLPPHVGMKLARQIATITYRSGPEWEQRFGRRRLLPKNEKDSDGENDLGRPILCPDFLIEAYLDHQGEQFCLKYDANSLIYISKAMDLFDMTQEGLEELNRFKSDQNLIEHSKSPEIDSLISSKFSKPHHNNPKQKGVIKSLPTYESEIVNSLSKTFERFKEKNEDLKFLVLGVQSDVLFPINLQRQLAESIRLSNGNYKNLTYYELDSQFGHDTFLIDLAGVGGAIRGFLS